MYEIRYATSHDAKALGEIHAKSWKKAYRGIVPDHILDNISAEKRQKYFEKVIREGSEANALIFMEDTAVGFICIGKCRDEDKKELDHCGEVWGLYILPEFWNRGFGSKIMNWGINELTSQGYTTISLWVLKDNRNARIFYEKYGFRFEGTVKDITIGQILQECRYERVIHSNNKVVPNL